MMTVLAPVNDRFFLGLLDTLLPRRNGLAAMLQAYFDASRRPSGAFCVAGYAFAKPQVKKFDKEWWSIFGAYGGCHMKELTQRRGRFKTVNPSQAGELLKRGVQIIKRRISFGVTISCDVNEMNALLPTWIGGFQHAYPVCCHLAMHALGNLVRKSGHDDEIAYFFESGDEYSGVAHNFMARAIDTPELKESYRYGSHSFIGKDKALPLQAADVLAWEWAKYLDETVTRNIRLMRKSLAALLSENTEYDSKRYGVNHVTGDALKRFGYGVAKVGLLQLGEQKAAKAKPPSASSPSGAE